MSERTAPVTWRTRLAIAALATGGFGIGSAEFATMGLLPEIADGLGATIPQAGWSVSAYAVGVVVGAPLITAVTARLERRLLLILMTGIFILGNLASVLAGSLGALIAARFVTGLPHGAYLGVAAVVAAGLVPPQKRGTAMARIILGLTVANIAGVPVATALGRALGWQAAFGFVGATGLLTLAGLLALVPRTPVSQTVSARREFAALARPQVWLALVSGAIGFGGAFAFYTYISPTMTDLTGFDSAAVPWLLMVYGIGMTLGSLVAGPCVDRSIDGSSIAGVVGMGAILLLFAGFGHLPVVAIVVLLTLGTGTALFTTGLQAMLLRESGDAPNVSAAMNHAAFNMANALGAYLGGLTIAAGWGYRAPSALGAALTIAGLAVLLVALRAGRHRSRTVVVAG